MNVRLLSFLSVLSIAVSWNTALAQRGRSSYAKPSLPKPPVQVKPLPRVEKSPVFVDPKRGVDRDPFNPLSGKLDYSKLMDLRESHMQPGYGDPLFAAENDGNLIVYCLGPNGPIPVNEAAAAYMWGYRALKAQLAASDPDNNIEWLVRMHTGKANTKILIEQSAIPALRRVAIPEDALEYKFYLVDPNSGASEKLASLGTPRGPPVIITATISPGLIYKISDSSFPHALVKQLAETPVTVSDFVYFSSLSQHLSFIEPVIDKSPRLKAIRHKYTNNTVEYMDQLIYKHRGKIIIMHDHIDNGEIVLGDGETAVRIPLENLEATARRWGCVLIVTGCYSAFADTISGYGGRPNNIRLVENIDNGLRQPTLLGFLRSYPRSSYPMNPCI